jgi:hypothetical protein
MGSPQEDDGTPLPLRGKSNSILFGTGPLTAVFGRGLTGNFSHPTFLEEKIAVCFSLFLLHI